MPFRTLTHDSMGGKPHKCGHTQLHHHVTSNIEIFLEVNSENCKNEHARCSRCNEINLVTWVIIIITWIWVFEIYAFTQFGCVKWFTAFSTSFHRVYKFKINGPFHI